MQSTNPLPLPVEAIEWRWGLTFISNSSNVSQLCFLGWFCFSRLDTEEMLGEEKKTFEIMKKDAEAMAKKTKVIDHSLAAAEKDLEDFQVCFYNVKNIAKNCP